MIGTLGPVVFFVSEKANKTFKDFSKSDQGRWAKHDIIGRLPVPEFLGPDLGSISFKMRFDIAHGIHPRKEMDKLAQMVRDGRAYPLVIAGKGLGAGKWSLQRVSQDWKHVDNRGNVLVSEVSVELEEYA